MLSLGKEKNWKTILKKMGYYKDQKGILNRYMREAENWDTHLQKSRDFILDAAYGKQKNHAVILGSGWLLDIPLEELSNQFKKITLIDIIHPSQIKKKIEKYANVGLIEADLTGGMVYSIYEAVQVFKKKNEIPLIQPHKQDILNFDTKPDFYISANILTQLGGLIKEYLQKQKGFPEKEINELEKTIQENHISMMQQGKSCIVTEFEEEIYDEKDNLIGANPLLKVNLPEGKKEISWKWKFDTHMYYREDAKTFMNVKAIDF
jgi:hypothetical protein